MGSVETPDLRDSATQSLETELLAIHVESAHYQLHSFYEIRILCKLKISDNAVHRAHTFLLDIWEPKSFKLNVVHQIYQCGTFLRLSLQTLLCTKHSYAGIPDISKRS
jgi:hypothetical protein